MIHQPLAGSEGTATELEIHALEFRRLKRRLNDILIRHTGRSIEEIDRDTDRDKFMSAEESAAYGLVDRVLEQMEPGLAGHQAKSTTTET
jgi:ATP-dependent Clp protease protease subunit